MNIDGLEIDVVEGGRRRAWATMSYRGVGVREWIPRSVQRSSEKYIEGYMEKVAARLRARLYHRFNQTRLQRGRLREARESQAAILFRRLAKMHGADPGSLKVVGAKPSECLRAIRKWIAAGKPEFGEVG